MVDLVWIACPYCGETFEIEVDTSAGDQRYIEDCRVCCRPIEFVLTVDEAGQVTALETRRDDD